MGFDISISGSPLLWAIVPVIVYAIWRVIATAGFIATRQHLRRIRNQVIEEQSRREALEVTKLNLQADMAKVRSSYDALVSAIVIHREQVDAIVSGDGVPHFTDESDEFTQADAELYQRLDKIQNGNTGWSPITDNTLQEPPEFLTSEPKAQKGGLIVQTSTEGETPDGER